MSNVQMNFALDEMPEETLVDVIQQFIDVVYHEQSVPSDEKDILEYKIVVLTRVSKVMRDHIRNMEIRIEELEEEDGLEAEEDESDD